MSSSEPVRCGDVWLVDFSYPLGRDTERQRPAVVVSANRLNESPAALAIVVPCTRRWAGLPSHIPVPAGLSGLDDMWFAKAEDVRSAPLERLGRRLGTVGPQTLNALRDVLATLLDL